MLAWKDVNPEIWIAPQPNVAVTPRRHRDVVRVSLETGVPT